MKKRIYLLALLAWIMTGCATVPVAKQPIQTTRIYNADYDAVWKAVVSVLIKDKQPIKLLEKESGVVTTDFVLEKGAGALGLWDRRYTLNILVSKITDESTQLQVSVYMQLRFCNQEWMTLGEVERKSGRTYVGDIERKLLDRVDEELVS